MPIPFLGSWCRVSGKGSLRQGRPLGSPQPACVSSLLRVGSSNIHCSRARRTGTYHSSAGGGGGRGRAGRLLRRPLRIYKPSGRRRRTFPSPVPSVWSPRPRTRERALRSRPSGWVREEGGGAGLRDTRPADAACLEPELGVRALSPHHLCC